MKRIKLTTTALTLLLIASCGREAEITEDSGEDLPENFVACPDERPEACIQIYQPVCAKVDTGVRCVTTPCPDEEWQTRGNSCTACTDPQVSGYIDGECDSSNPPTE